MGLDTVELVIEVEESFGFSIDDNDASSLETVGDLYAYILDHRFRGKTRWVFEQRCLLQTATRSNVGFADTPK